MKSFSIAALVAFIAVGLCLIGCKEPKPSQAAKPESSNSATTPSTSSSATSVSLDSLGLTSKGWFQVYDQALAKSKETGKPILMEFTGSDWCPPCKALTKNVFGTDEFRVWAEQHVVLLELDFPRSTSLPEAQQQQNDTLAKKHGVGGFPTVIMLDSSENTLGKTSGYDSRLDIDAYLKKFQEMINP